jgi:hypothetical protein
LEDNRGGNVKKRRFAFNAMLGLSFWASITGSVVAQEPPTTNGASVQMLVTVEAVRGSDVPVVNREDVMVQEGRERDKVSDWVPAQGDHAGLELVFLLDDSSNSSLGSQLEGSSEMDLGTAGLDQGWDCLHAEWQRKNGTEPDERPCSGGESLASSHRSAWCKWQCLLLS